MFAIYTQQSSYFDNFSSKNANLDNFFPKKCNFPLLKVKKMWEKFFTIFLLAKKKIDFSAENSPMITVKEYSWLIVVYLHDYV